MRNIVLKSFVLLTGCFLVACSEKDLPEDAVYDPRFPETDGICSQAKDLLKQADNIFMLNNYLVELYTQTADSKKLQLVSDFNNPPVNLASTYNIIRNKSGEIMYVAEFPYAESGDWENIYESVYNDKGDLISFVRKSSFFVEDVIVYEKSEYFYNEDHKLVKKTYQVKYAEKEGIPENIKVDFQYRFPYEKHTTRKKWLEAHEMEK